MTAVSGLTNRIVALTTGRIEPTPAEAVALAERSIVDIVAVSFAALGDPGVEAGFRALVEPVSDGLATVLLSGARTSAPQAALLGGLAAHALDYDDVDDAFIGHPSAVLVPAVLAVAEELDASGAEVADAFWTGLRACRMIAAVLGIGPHYAAGWHSTSSLGSLAAAVAVARLRRLDGVQVAHALGIAGSLAFGSRQNFGTMTKALHAGWAAEVGVRAARLAAAGFTADARQLEGPLGFLALHRGSATDPAEHDVLLDGAPGIELAALNLKLYPCCYYSHAAVEAALELAHDGAAGRDCASAVVTVQPGGLAPLIHHRPRTGLEGKFSLEYLVAAALLDGAVTLATFQDAMVLRPAVQDLLARVEVREAVAPPAGGAADGAFAVVEYRAADGSTTHHRVDRPLGHASRPVPDERLREKFRDCLATFPGSAVDDAFALLRNLGADASVRSAVARLVGVLHRDVRRTA